jgi:hypothetical protein
MPIYVLSDLIFSYIINRKYDSDLSANLALRDF